MTARTCRNVERIFGCLFALGFGLNLHFAVWHKDIFSALLLVPLAMGLRHHLKESEKLTKEIMKNEKCYLHPEADAAKALNIPCAPGGKLFVCAACSADPDMAKKVFEKYQAEHAKRIELFKTPGNPGN